jgi:predicted DNA-binding protein YlxM (UPF0122 family)
MQSTRARLSSEKSTRMKALLDIYGSLLTRKQLALALMHFGDHLSLSEIGRRQNVSRQAVHDAIRHVTRILEDYEDKLRLLGNVRPIGLPAGSPRMDDVKAKLDDLKAKLLRQRIVYSVDWVVQDINLILEFIAQPAEPVHPKPLDITSTN